ncbi:MAG: Holliday junction DNA helicase RuvB [Candidatus Niyogibacteria bacterium RIFCSPLOWO2_12_FULL_41_13]|uniref:Holliday junction branch migration complex subunit RuvB n=1 Tax=Candidatus Niyogibacteria bacterium RIFCSPLOWO2_12_FULL_41_13 TaxID=1801726 RepID=A0A1G2F268_9BACT|nr:MAG: Holliday junction DNA helicase RuvB [Candidatus Niyogibacteria bacterium RIFCSPLOWO2_12_FULL_41_13]
MLNDEPKEQQNDTSLDAVLRPNSWGNYIGQETIKKNLSILIRASREREEPVEHLLFYGPSGLGKTTLAYLVAKEMGVSMKITSGPAIERAGDLASILTNLMPGEILFIDEIHRLNKMIEEILYPAMENRQLDIIIGKGPGARSIQIDLPPFSLIAATTRISLLSSPLRARFSGGIFKLDYYIPEEIKKIILNSAKILKIPVDEDAALFLAERSRFTPRVANRLLKRARDYAQIHRYEKINLEVVQKTLELLQIDEHGLEEHDRKILESIVLKFNGGPVGVQTLAAAASEEIGTIEDVYEPYLLRLGFLEKTPRGRKATEKAFGLFGKKLPQQKLV